jgi:hypothetical protein
MYKLAKPIHHSQQICSAFQTPAKIIQLASRFWKMIQNCSRSSRTISDYHTSYEEGNLVITTPEVGRLIKKTVVIAHGY